jgi:hypothetical protein
MKHVTAHVKDYTFGAILAGVLAMPIAAHAEGNSANKGATANPPTTNEQTFNTLDTDRSGAVSEAEYLVHAQQAQNLQADEATTEFQKLDANKDNRLTLAELKSGSEAYKKNIQ